MRNIWKKKAKIIAPNGKFETITLKPTKTHRQENYNDAENDCEMSKSKDDEEYFLDKVEKKKKLVKKVKQICHCPCDDVSCFILF